MSHNNLSEKIVKDNKIITITKRANSILEMALKIGMTRAKK